MNGTNFLLRVSGLVVEGRGEKHGWQGLVNGVSLNVRRGEVLGLIGESGAGKSTIGLASMGYVRAGCRIASGTVALDGQQLAGADHEKLRAVRGVRIAYVAQSAAAAFNPAHTLNFQVCETAVTHGLMSTMEARRAALRLYERLHIPDPANFGNRYPHQVSGGQLQRAMTAMAMICKPALIVFDEPTTALDVTTQIEVLAAIRDAIRGERMAALYVSHDLAVVAQVADRIMVLRDGLLIEEGQAVQILQKPRDPYTRALVNVRRVESPVRKKIGVTPIVDVRGVTACYPGGPAVVRDVSIALAPSMTLALVGESGSGKSSLARVVTGLLSPKSGHCFLDGMQLAAETKHRSKEQLRRIQMIYQMPDVALNPRQNVGEILGRPLQFYFGRRREAVQRRLNELLSMVDLSSQLLSRFPGELSGGQKQRLCIARALAAKPDAIVCDEITSALDPLVADGILRLLLEIQKETKVSYLFITHDIATVSAIADEIAVMLKGEIVQQGPKEQVLTAPSHPYTELLLSSVPAMDVTWLDRFLAERSCNRTKLEVL